MSQALYRKWRPARFDQVVGQEHITRTLQNSVAADRVGHAYLFCGPRGTGKTTSARLLAKAVNCLNDDLAQRPCDDCHVCRAINSGRFLDLIEIDAASNTGVDDIRDLRDKINFAPNEGRFKVYIIDEVHMLSTAAFNALLKTLEEPPPHAKFVLATTEEHKVPLTIKSRCQQYNFRLLTNQEIIQRLEWLTEQEGLKVEPEALSLVAQHGAGSLRDSESLLDQLIGAPDDEITLKRAQMVLGTAGGESIRALTEAILTADGPVGLQIIHEALATGADARQFCRQMVGHLRQLLLLQTAGDAIRLDVPPEEQAAMATQAERGSRQTLLHAVRQFNEAANTASTSWQPQLPLELAFIESLPAEPAPAVSDRVVRAAATQPAPPPQPIAPPEAEAEEEATAVAEPEAIAEAAAPPATAAAPPRGGALTVEEIKGKTWREFVAKAGSRNRNIKNWLNSSQPLAVEGNTLVIGFDLAFLKSKLESEQTAVEAVLSSVLGEAYTIRCVMKEEYVPAAAAPKKNFRAEVDALAQELGAVVRESE